MSASPPIRRRNSTKREEDLINAYEAEEERIINILSRKLEQLREDKINLERAHEEESESTVNRLSRELTVLRLQQFQAQIGSQSEDTNRTSTLMRRLSDAPDPSTEVLLEALKRENERLRSRLVATERDYVRITRSNEIYREELIQHRRRLGLPVDNLIGMGSTDPYSQPLHRRRSSTASSSPTASMVALPLLSGRPSTNHAGHAGAGVPIPRQTSSQMTRPKIVSSTSETPLSYSPSSSESPFPFSPVLSGMPKSYVSNATQLTTPPSSASLQTYPPAPNMPPASLSYPSVPPPSLSSSLGSPTIPYHLPYGRDPPSPVDSFSLSRRPSMNVRRGNRECRVAESGNLREMSRSRSRRESVERGGRVAETGTLVRGREGSFTGIAPVINEDETDDVLDGKSKAEHAEGIQGDLP